MRRPAALSVTDRPAGTGGRGIPALDGVRALAVLGVLADHAGVPGLSGGFVGVDVFFVLSGFLITSLLLDEHRRTGRVDLGAFWARRARRLLPALTVLVAAVALGRRLFAPDSVGGLRYDALSALGWVANWRFAAAKTDYFAQGGAASPLQHTWSLGVEEQYYLVWPLVLTAVTVLLAHRSRASVRRLATLATVGVLATVGAIASAAEAVWLSGNAAPGRVYFGSDTRAQALLAGAAAAAVFARRWPLSDGPSRPAGTRKRGQLAAAAAAMAGLAALVVLAHTASGAPADFRHALLTAAALASVALVVGVTLAQRSPLARLLAMPPLRGLGRISYGVYLWHWPTFLAVDGERTGLTGLPLLTARVAVTLALATASWFLVERPVSRWSSARPATTPVSTPAATAPRRTRTVALGAAVVGAAVLVVATVPNPIGQSRAVAGDPVAGIVGSLNVQPTTGRPPGSSGAKQKSVFSQQHPSGAKRSSVATAPKPANRPLTIDVFGDSIAWTLMRYLPPTPGIRFIDRTVVGCGIVEGAPYRYFGAVADQHPQCENWQSTWAQQLATDRPDEALLLVGRWETMDRVHDGQWTHIGESGFDDYLSGQLDSALAVLGSTGARVVAATEPYNRRGEQPDGSLYPEDHPERVTAWNNLLTQAVRRRHGTDLIDFGRQLCPDGHFTWDVDGITVRSDGVHLTPDAVGWLTPWLTSQLRANT